MPDTDTQINVHTPDVESIFFQRRQSRLRGDKSQAPDSCEDIFRGLCEPAAFTLFPYGDIHQPFLECHSCTKAGVRSISTWGQLYQLLFFKFLFLCCSRGTRNVLNVQCPITGYTVSLTVISFQNEADLRFLITAFG